MALTDGFVADLRRQRQELVEALAKIDAALAIFEPSKTPAPQSRVKGRRRQRNMREGSTNSYILTLMREHADRSWDAATVAKAIRERGWTTTAKDPEHSIRSALYVLCREGKLSHAGTPGQYQWPHDSSRKSFGPAAVTTGPKEAGEDPANQVAVQTEPEALALPA
jgi:hypothetical protein